MAIKYRVAAGNWNAAKSWALTNGGTDYTTTPTLDDDAVFTTLTPTGTHILNVIGNCKNLDFTTWSGTFNQSQSISVYGDFLLSSTMTYTPTGYKTMRCPLAGASIKTAGKNMGSSQITLAGTNGCVFTLQDNFTSTGQFNVSAGCGLDTNNKNLSCSGLSASSSTGAYSIVLGSSTVTLTGNLQLTNSSGLSTMNAGTSTINVGGTSLAASGFTLYNVTLTTSGTVGLTSNITFNNLTRTGGTSLNGILGFPGNSSVTINGNLVVNGNYTMNRVLVKGTSSPSISNVYVGGTISGSNFDIQDVNFTGPGAPFDVSGITGGCGDCEQVTGITFAAPVTTNWISGTTWSGSTWSVRVPLAHDTATFTTAGTASITVDVARIGSVDFTGSSNKTFVTSANLSCFGNMDLTGLATYTPGATNLSFVSVNSRTVKTNGKVFNSFITASLIGTVTIKDNLTVTNAFTVTSGTFSALDGVIERDVTVGGTFTLQSAGTFIAGNLITITGTSNFSTSTTTGGSNFIARNSVIKFTGALVSDQFITLNGVPLNNIWIATTGAFNVVFLTGCSMNDLKMDATRRVTFTGGYTNNINTITLNGTTGNNVVLSGTSSAVLGKLGAGNMVGNYCTVSNLTFAPRNTWYFTNSTDGGGNVNATFSAPTTTQGISNMLQYL